MQIQTQPTTPETHPRLQALDALRGFDMFWIIGGGGLVQILAKCFPQPWLQALAAQMEHVKWAGFHFEDLIFPLFMFISGATIPLAIGAKLAMGAAKPDLIGKVTRRMALLILLGLVFNGILRNGFANARYASVLGQIGIAYFIAALVVIQVPAVRGRIGWLIGILAGYAAIQLWVPVPGVGAGVLTPEGCINSYLDRMLLPGKLGQGTYDALGLMCVLSASAVTLMGSFAGAILVRVDLGGGRKAGLLAALGAGLVVLALGLSPFYPIIKGCWTSTYNLLAGGLSFLLVAAFYLVIDVWGVTKWSFLFRVIGLNSIFIYLVVTGNLVNLSSTANSLFGWLAKPLGDNSSQLVMALGNLAVAWGLLYFMFRHKIFLKV